MPVTIKALKKENSGLRTQVEALMTQINNLQAKGDGTIVSESSHASTPMAEIYISTAREQNSLGMIGVSHDGYHVAYLTIIPQARMGYESIAHEAEGRMGY